MLSVLHQVTNILGDVLVFDIAGIPNPDCFDNFATESLRIKIQRVVYHIIVNDEAIRRYIEYNAAVLKLVTSELSLVLNPASKAVAVQSGHIWKFRS